MELGGVVLVSWEGGVWCWAFACEDRPAPPPRAEIRRLAREMVGAPPEPEALYPGEVSGDAGVASADDQDGAATPRGGELSGP